MECKLQQNIVICLAKVNIIFFLLHQQTLTLSVGPSPKTKMFLFDYQHELMRCYHHQKFQYF